MIDDKATFQIDRTRIQFERFEDETVLINVESGFYYSISQSGSELLRLVDGGCPAGMLVAAIVGDSEKAVHHSPEIIRFVENLICEGILVGGNSCLAADQSIDISRPVYSSTEGFEPPVLERFDEVRDLLLIDPVHMVDQAQGWPKT